MKLVFALSALSVAFACAAMSTQGASAQTGPIPITVQVGVGSQLSSSARNQIGSTSLHAGASLQLSDTTTLFALPGNEGIDLDYNHGSGNGGHFDAYGATYTNRISLLPKLVQPLTAHIVPYVGFGIGYFENAVTRRETVTTGSGSTASTTTKTVSHTTGSVGGKLLAGIQTPTGLFVEASYIVSGSSEGVRTDSINLAIGTHL